MKSLSKQIPATIRTRSDFEREESARLSPFGVPPGGTAGRARREPGHAFRSEIQRDRARIIHCSAFRRLDGKTQVFLNGSGDHYRTRLTHTIEVASISRTIARALRLNEDWRRRSPWPMTSGIRPAGTPARRSWTAS
ncbi:MAG: hypothetical protein WC076_10635 [Terrimicrobiaceae bacterium]|nr:hypothetical protein [Terrimicrobiaceae bacterium]